MPTNSTRTEYQKERRRVLQAVRRLEQGGATVDRSLIPELKKHPTKRDVDILKTIKPSTLRSNVQLKEKRTVPTTATNKSKSKKYSTSIKKVKVDSTQGVKPKRVPTTKAKPSTPKVKANKPAKVKIPKSPKVKIPKTPLTSEQKHEIRVKAGRKAWETRRGKMTEQEFEEFKKKFSEQMKQARDIKKKIETDLAGGEFTFEMPPENVVDLGILDLIERAINDIPVPKYVRTRGRFFAGYFWNEDYPLLSVFYGYINDVGEEKASEYYRSVEQELMATLQQTVHDSEQDDMEHHLSLAMSLLAGGRALTIGEAIALNEYEEQLPFNIGDYNA